MKKKLLSMFFVMAMICTIITINASAEGVSLATDKEAYTINEKMIITVAGTTPEGSYVSIHEKDARVDQYIAYEYPSNLISGKWEATTPSKVGNYEIRMYGEDGVESSLLTKIPLTVKYITDKVATVKADKSSYTPSEKMTVIVEGLSQAQQDSGAFVSIYKKGARHDQYGTYGYIKDLIANKWESTSPSQVGDYELRLYAADGAYVDENLYVTVPFKVVYSTTQATLQMSKNKFAPNEKITVNAEGVTAAQMESGAFVGIYKKSARYDQYTTYQHIKSLIANKWETEAPYETGEYEMRLYAADAADALLVSVPFTIEGSPIETDENDSVEFVAGYEGVSGWAVSEVNAAVDDNLTTDKVVVEFQKPITREEFAELAVKLYEAMTGKKAEAAPVSTFKDTTNVEILKAYNLNVIKGVGNGIFAPNNSVTRQEIATMLLRVVKAALPNADTTVSNPTVFSDSYEIANWANEGVNYFSSKGIIKGANGAFLPLANTTREAAIALIKRTFDSFSGI